MKKLQHDLIQSWYTQGYITIIEKQTLEFMNNHTAAHIKHDIKTKNNGTYDVIIAVDPATYRTVFEKTIQRNNDNA